jgi:hypothetical protein
MRLASRMRRCGFDKRRTSMLALANVSATVYEKGESSMQKIKRNDDSNVRPMRAGDHFSVGVCAS